MENSFENKRCVVTGAGSGIGRALACNLAAQGAVLALSDINETSLDETRALINAGDNRHRFDRLNVADFDAIDAYAADLAEGWGDADFVFNNAGLTRLGAFKDTDFDAFEEVLNVNFRGLAKMSHAFLPQLLRTKGGLINIASIFGIIGVPGQSHYCASKFAVRGFSEVLAQELAPHGVRVTSVQPGGIKTNIARNAKVDKLPGRMKSEAAFVNNFDKSAMTTPERAAAVILAAAAKGKRRVMIGPDARLLSFIQRLFPRGYQWFISRVAGA